MTTSDLPRRRRMRVVRSAHRNNSPLDRPISWRWLNREVLAYVALILLSVIMHLWSLGSMAMHHDESIHAKFSWQFYTGRGDFNCWIGRADTYCYDPVFHGPTLYLLTYLSYFLFGVSDATARLPMALAGVALVASCWMLRPIVGKRAALWTAVLMVLSPTLLYFTRFARHDALAILWTFWIMVGLFRYMQERRGRWLYLAAGSLALLWATHELVFIIGFVVFTFLLQRLIWETWGSRAFLVVTGGFMLLGALLVIFNPTISLPTAAGQAANILHFGGLGFVLFMTLLIGQLVSLRWSSAPLLRNELRYLARHLQMLWTAIGVFLAIFAVCFTTFFTYPRGFVDGWYAGISYWLGTQHAVARGDQPWYYYFMQLGVYELLPMLLLLVGTVAWLGRPLWRRVQESTGDVHSEQISETIIRDSADPEMPDVYGTSALGSTEADLMYVADTKHDAVTHPGSAIDQTHFSAEQTTAGTLTAEPAIPPAPPLQEPAESQPWRETIPLMWIGYSIYWFFLAFTVFSWAGEKMPWLTIHMTLPAIVVGGWTLDRLSERINWTAVRERLGWLIVPLTWAILILLLVASASFGGGVEQQAQRSQLNGYVLLIVALAAGVAIWSIAERIGRHSALRLVGLSVAGLLAIYAVRASMLAAYRQPDVPVELLVYTQTAPDIPLIVDQVERIAVAQTRTQRSATDPTGGHNMPILISAGQDSGSEGSLHQPLDWYLRDWTNIRWLKSSQIANLTPADLEVPVAIFSRSTMAPDTEQKMIDAGYVKVYDSVHNWWFPEWDSGYKDRIYDINYGCDPSLKGQYDENGQARYDCVLGGIQILTWPFRPSNWDTLRRYMLWRELPATTNIGTRDIAVFMQRDVAPLPSDGDQSFVARGSNVLKLVSEGTINGPAPTEPRGIATGPDGTLYIADAAANQILVYRTDGTTDTFTGDAEVDLLEPSAIAVDEDGNIYVADTWHARVVKLDPEGNVLTTWGSGETVIDPVSNRVFSETGGTAEGNAAKPLGFFGPRGIATANGFVYLADTGNKRIVVTDDEGTVVGQIGTAGAGPGQFNEPIGVGVAGNNLVVGDTWNGRVQVFALNADGLPAAQPAASWNIPGWKADSYLDPFVAVDNDGRVIVTIPERNVASLYNLSGELLLTWGGDGTDDTSMQHPSGIAFAPDGSVYIAEKRAQHIERWDLPEVR